jgi:hypothetical protein
MAKPPGPGGPLYLESYKIPVGNSTRFEASITLDTDVTDADVIVEIDDGDGGWTVVDSTTASFVADTAKTLFVIFGYHNACNIRGQHHSERTGDNNRNLHERRKGVGHNHKR